MEDLMLTGGNTPFERAAANRALAHKQLTIMCAIDELIKLIAECDTMLATWRDEVKFFGVAKDEPRIIAAEALKDKRAAEAALEEIMKNAEALGFTE